MCLFAAALALILSFRFCNLKYQKAADFATEENVSYEAIFLERNSVFSSGTYCTVRLRSISGTPINCKATLFLPTVSDLSVNNIFSGYATIQPPGDTDSEIRQSMADGIFLSLEADNGDYTLLGQDTGIGASLRLWKAKLSGFVEASLKRDAAALVSAMLFGNRFSVNAQIRLNFRMLGISHLLAISGMHLSVVAYLLHRMMRRLFPPRAAIPIVIAAIWLFAALIGLPYSVVRAAIMLTFIQASFLLRRENDTITALVAAAAIITAVSPMALFSLSFQMSFLATLGLCTLGFAMQKALVRRISAKHFRGKILRYFLSLSCATISAVLFTLPTAVYAVGSLSAVCLTMSFVFIPLSTVFLSVAPLLVPLLGVAGIGSICSTVLNVLADSILLPAAFCSRHFSLMLPLQHFYVLFLLLPMIVGSILILRRPYHRVSRLLTLLCATALLYSVCSLFSDLQSADTADISYFVSGKNELVTLQTDRNVLLCDITNGSYTQVRKAAKSLSAASRSGKIDLYLLTHYHKRHLTTLTRLMQEYYIDVMLAPAPKNEQEMLYVQALALLAEENQCRIFFFDVESDPSITLGNCTLTLLDTATADEETHPDITFTLTMPGHRLLYAGAASSALQGDDFRLSYSDIDIVICGVHAENAALSQSSLSYFPNLQTLFYANTLPPDFDSGNLTIHSGSASMLICTAAEQNA